MLIDQVVESLIGEYLERKGLNNTLESFQLERRYPKDDLKGLLIDDLVQDRLNYISKYATEQEDEPVVNNLIENKELFDTWEEDSTVPLNWNSLNINNSLVIHLSSGRFKSDKDIKDVLFISLSNKELILVDLDTKKELTRFKDIHGGILGKLTYCLNDTNLILSCNMNGELKLFKIEDGLIEKVSDFKIHNRLVIDIKVFENDGEYLIFSIGWDFYLNCTKLKDGLFEKIDGTKLLTLPNSIEIGTFEKKPILFLTRNDSTRLFVFTIIDTDLAEISRISLNDSQFTSNEFSAMSISISNYQINSKTLIGITTSHIPFLRVLILKLDLKQIVSQYKDKPVDLYNQLVGNFNTLSPQDKYSSPILQWIVKDDKINGCWIPGDDGIIRGLKFKDGKIFQLLGLINDDGENYVKVSYKGEDEENVHSQRIKCFVNHRRGGREILVSSGVDKKLILWS